VRLIVDVQPLTPSGCCFRGEGLHEGAADAPSLVVGVDGRVEAKAWEPPSQQAWTKPTSEPRSKAPIQVRLWRCNRCDHDSTLVAA
jgi:hypothetical protein